MTIKNKSLLKEIEGEVIEKVSVSEDKQKIKIKTDRGTLTVLFTTESISTNTEYSTQPSAEVFFKPSKESKEKQLPKKAVWPPLTQTDWPFPSGNKP